VGGFTGLPGTDAVTVLSRESSIGCHGPVTGWSNHCDGAGYVAVPCYVRLFSTSCKRATGFL